MRARFLSDHAPVEIEGRQVEPTLEDAYLYMLGEQDYLVSGRIEVGQLRERLGISIRLGAYQTLAGYLLEKLHEVPPVDAVVESHRIRYTIAKRTDTVIEEVRITW